MDIIIINPLISSVTWTTKNVDMDKDIDYCNYVTTGVVVYIFTQLF